MAKRTRVIAAQCDTMTPLLRTTIPAHTSCWRDFAPARSSLLTSALSCSPSSSGHTRALCSTTHSQMLTTIEILDQDGTARSALPPPPAPSPDTGSEKTPWEPFRHQPLTIALLGGGVGVCLLLCGGLGYHVCVRRPRQRRWARFQDVEFQVQGRKLELQASPGTHYIPPTSEQHCVVSNQEPHIEIMV